MKLSRTETLALECYAYRGPYGLTDEELHIQLGIPWNTANALRYGLWQRNLVCATPYRRPTTKGALATVYAYDTGGSDLPVKAVPFSAKDKVKARAALFAMVMRDLEMGLAVPPEVIQLGRWLDSKVLLEARKEAEKRHDKDR